MARPRKNDSNELIRLIDEYFSSEAAGDPSKLKSSLLEKYAYAHGVTAKAYDFRRDPEVQAHISYLKKLVSDERGSSIVGEGSYKTLDIRSLIRKYKDPEELISVLSEMDEYWKNVYDACQSADAELTGCRKQLSALHDELKALKEKLQKTGFIKDAQQPAQPQNKPEQPETKTPASNPAETGNAATVQGDKLVGPDGKQVTIPEGCKIEGGKVIDANGAEVTVNANGAVTQTTYSEGSSVKGGKVYNKNGKEVKLPEGYKVAGNKVIGPNGNEVRLDANGNILKADHQLQLKDARTARERQQNLAKGTDDRNRKENILNGSSEYYSDMNDEQLSSQLANLQGDPNDIMGNINGKNSIGASKIQSELDGRQQYRNQMDLLAADKQSNSDKFNQILDITGQVANTAMSVAGMFMAQNQEGEAKKKQAAPGKLTKRTKEIMRKNAQYRQRRVQALARAQRYYA